jgi:hypothetical protein
MATGGVAKQRKRRKAKNNQKSAKVSRRHENQSAA